MTTLPTGPTAPRTISPPQGGSGGSDAYVAPPTYRFGFRAVCQYKHWNGYGDEWRNHDNPRPVEVTVIAETREAAETKAHALLPLLQRDFRWKLSSTSIEEVS